MADYKLIIKYIKVRALAEQGSPGERDNAARMLTKLENENPALKSQVAAFERTQQPQDNLPPGVTPKNGASNYNRGFWNPGNWENLFQYAQTAASAAYNFAESVANAQRGALLAGAISIQTRVSRKGEIVVSFKIPATTYRHMLNLNEAQRSTLKYRLRERLESELDRLMGHSG